MFFVKNKKQKTFFTSMYARSLEKIRKRRLAWFGHVTRMKAERWPLQALQCEITGKRDRGHPIKKWMDNVKEDLNKLSLDMRQAMDLIWQRDKWKHLIKTSSSS